MKLGARTSVRQALGATAIAATLAIIGGCGDGAAERASTPACGESTGQTVRLDLDISMAGFNDRHALVHLPPCYEGDTASYPVVYLLHGGGQEPESWTDPPIVAAATADRMAVDAAIDPVILVMPPRSTKPTGFPEILDALIAEVDATYRTIDDPSGRAIGGFSASGRATAQSAFTGAPRANAIGLFAVTWPTVLHGEIVDGMDGRTELPSVYVSVGDRDRLRNRIPEIERTLAAIGIEPTVEIVPGSHDVVFVADNLPAWLRWFDSRW